jgi:hypothetical protein
VPRQPSARPPAAEAPPWQATWRGFAAFWLFAFLLRAAFILAAQDRDWPFSIFFYGDSQHFRAAAEALAGGRLYDEGIPYHPPLYPLALGALFSLLGGPAAGAATYKLLMAGLNALGVALGWRWLRAALGGEWGDLGGILLAGSFGWYLCAANFCSESLYIPLLAGTLLLLARAGGRLGSRRALALGLLTGLATLTRAEHFTLFFFCGAAWWPARDRARLARDHLRDWALAAAVALVLVAPWTLRNWVRLGQWNAAHPAAPLPRFVPVTIYGPLNFALANQGESDGGFNLAPLVQLGGDGSLDVEHPAQHDLLLHGYRAGWRWIADHPAEALWLTGRKLSRWLDGLKLGWGSRALPGGDTGRRPAVDLFIPAGGDWLKWMLVAALALGCTLAARGREAALRIALAIVMHRLLVTAVFFGYVRGMMIVLPAVFALILLAARRAAAGRPGLARAPRQLAVAIALLLAADASVRLMSPPRSYLASGSSDGRGKLIQDAAVELRPLP